jgi:crotonobetainyl-CoA:carnitine CoA-transferase CaiB-like acyl-CoA transferase
VTELEAAFAARSLDEWRKPLDDARIPWGPYQRVDELLQDPAVVANGYIGTVERPDGITFPLPAGAVQFDEQPAALHACPDLGEHTDEVLASLGYSWDDIVTLKVKGAIL